MSGSPRERDQDKITSSARPPFMWAVARYARFLLPPRFREHYYGDILDIFVELGQEGQSKFSINLALLLHVGTVFWHVIKLQPEKYFGAEQGMKRKIK